MMSPMNGTLPINTKYSGSDSILLTPGTPPSFSVIYGNLLNQAARKETMSMEV